MEKMKLKNLTKRPFLGEISALRTEMPIRVYPFRKIVCKSLLWYHFLLLFFHKKNLGMGLLEYIMSSNKWKIYFMIQLLGHNVI